MTGYPTLKWMPKGMTEADDAEAVTAARTAEGLGQFITEKTGIEPIKASQVQCVYDIILPGIAWFVVTGSVVVLTLVLAWALFVSRWAQLLVRSSASVDDFV